MSNWEKTMKEWDDSVPDGIKYLSAEKQVLMRRVRELESENARLKEAMRWIPVSERLPEVYRDEDGDFIPFLVCEGDGGHPFRSMYNGVNWWAGIFVPDITHWMPMPTLPEVQE